ncbi:MAG: hypothetical protein NC102_01605 [Clostridium sp.]|nr:hypothetical protein [Clostridium sp.]
MRKIISIIFVALVFNVACGLNKDSIYPFNENGLWGLKINGEVCLLPGFDNLEKVFDINLFIYTQNGRKGIISPFGVVFSEEQADSIISVGTQIIRFIKDSKNYAAFIDDKNGIVGKPFRLDSINFWGDRLITYTVDDTQGVRLIGDTVDIIVPGQYKKIIGGWEFMPMEEHVYGAYFKESYIIAEDNQNEIHIFDTYYKKEDVSPFFSFSNLGGNSKKVAEGKEPLEKLWIKTESWKIRDKIDKEYRKSAKNNGPKGVNTGWGNFSSKGKSLSVDSIKDEDIMDQIAIGDYNGVITSFGTITIPIKYNSTGDLKKRDPSNPYSIYFEVSEQMSADKPKRHDRPWIHFPNSDVDFEISRKEYAEKTQYYKEYLAVWEMLYDYIKEIGMEDDPIYKEVAKDVSKCRDLYDENERKLDSYNRIASITNSLNSFANNLYNIASSMQSGSYNLNSYNSYNSSSIPASNTNGGKDYQGEYNRWAQRAEANYNSITRYSNTNKAGKKTSGSAAGSSSPATYSQQKKSYRTAQHEMARIAREASNAGVSIVRSEYEMLTISY